MNWAILVPFLAVVYTASAGLTGGRLLGGVEDADINDESLQNALQFAVVQHNKNSNDLYISQVSRVIKTQQQVVAGMKYIFTVELGRTSCRKGGAETECPIHQDPKDARPYQCTFEVWSRPWMNAIEVVKNKCLPQGESF